MPPDENDRTRDVFREVYQHVETTGQEPPTWSSIQKPATSDVSRRSGLMITATTAAAVLVLGVAGFVAWSNGNGPSPVGAPSGDGVVITMYLADDFDDLQLEFVTELLDTAPAVIEWVLVNEAQARDEARARYGDEESFLRALEDHPDIADSLIRVLVASPQDAIEIEALVLADAEKSGVLSVDISRGSSAMEALEIPIHDDGPADTATTTITTDKPVSDGPVCPVTIPPEPGFAPPDGYPSTPVSGVWYGSEGLWTVIEEDGISSPRMTVLWSINFPGGQEEEQPEVDVTWTRIDIVGEPISNGGEATNAYTPGDGDFMIAGLDPNEPGCWQVTATYKGATLSYVYLAPGSSSPTTTIPPTADPLFGDESPWVLLFDNGPGSVLAVDPNNPVRLRRSVYGDRAGDQPYRMTRVGNSLVVGWGIIYANDIVSGDSTPLGAASFYIPAAEPDRVWLVDWPGSGNIATGSTARQVDMEGRIVVERADFPDRAIPGIGIPGGIAIQTDTGLEAWYPGAENPVSLWGARQASVLDVNGSVLAFCPTEPCTDPHFIDIGTGRVSKVGLPGEVGSLDRGGGVARFSPDGSKMALATDRGVVVLDLETLLFTTIAPELTTTERPVYVSWSPDGEVLFASASSLGRTDMSVTRYNLATLDVQTAQLPYGGTMGFVVVDRDEAARFLDTSP
ncbi:MAG: hypothetical protein ACC654_11540 [Acidimicrobiia bacterium]